MEELIVNIHMHTRYSDGGGSHSDIARAAVRRGLDAVIVTDHNVLVRGMDRYVREGPRKVLILVGEEIHDRGRQLQGDHLLVLQSGQEFADLAGDTDELIRQVRRAGGLSFIAHPDESAAPAFREPDISWRSWSVTGFTGIELWNGFSELKSLLRTQLHGIFYAFFPMFIPHGPPAATLKRWDQMLRERPVVALGGSDAHAMRMHLGPLNRTVLPYEHHFGAINTHLLIPDSLTGKVEPDARSVYEALGAGHAFVGCDALHPTRGFRFTAHGLERQAIMGDEISITGGLTLQARMPAFAEIRLIRDGKIIKVAQKAHALAHTVDSPGAYRIEAYRKSLGRRRGWIFSNPVYVR